MSENWIDINSNTSYRINWRAVVVEAAVLVLAPIAHIKVVAVNKLVVGLLVGAIGPTLRVGTRIVSRHPWGEPVWH